MADITFSDARTILSKATGYISDYDYTLNPYRGCAFGCFYCYAAFFSGQEKQDRWGEWVDVKNNAVDLMRKFGVRMTGAKIYMSSVTDPYQPIELRTNLTRGLLEVMVEHQPRLVVQTRSPLVERDFDLLLKLKVCRVNMTITTDDDKVRRDFEPSCASIDRRFKAIENAKSVGLRTSICITPMLPIRDVDAFVQRLIAANADVYVSQAFQYNDFPFAASTRAKAISVANNYKWDARSYASVRSRLLDYIPNLYEGQDGFMPE